MKKLIKIIGGFVLAILILAGCLLVIIILHPAVPNDYMSKVTCGGPIEANYISMGPHDVSYFESIALSSFKKYEIYYPTDIDSLRAPLPVVVFVNGTGTIGSKYPALQKHLASWGFITIATDEEFAWNGFSAEMSVRYISLLHSYKIDLDGYNNQFYGKVDLDKIGITGHSQGGIGVFNAITSQEHANVYKGAVALSASNKAIASAIQWQFDETIIRTPILLISSTGPVDEKIADLQSLQELYGKIPDSTPKIMARRKDVDHGEMLYYADGYVTAWFMYLLKGDSAARQAFEGAEPELFRNPRYQDQESKMSREY